MIGNYQFKRWLNRNESLNNSVVCWDMFSSSPSLIKHSCKRLKQWIIQLLIHWKLETGFIDYVIITWILENSIRSRGNQLSITLCHQCDDLAPGYTPCMSKWRKREKTRDTWKQTTMFVVSSNRALLEWISPGLPSLRKQTVNLVRVSLSLDWGRGPLDPKGDNRLVIGSIEGFQMHKRSLSLFRSWETTFTLSRNSFVPLLGTIPRAENFSITSNSESPNQKAVLVFILIYITLILCLVIICTSGL